LEITTALQNQFASSPPVCAVCGYQDCGRMFG
jgi:hypothetical protein